MGPNDDDAVAFALAFTLARPAPSLSCCRRRCSSRATEERRRHRRCGLREARGRGVVGRCAGVVVVVVLVDRQRRA